jgi:hypothetical protein
MMLPGCSYRDVRLKPPTSGLKTPIPGGNERQVIVAAPFADARQITNRCGMWRSDLDIVISDAPCEGDPTQWIASLLASELTASGFTVLPAEGGARDSALKVEGILLKIFAEPVFELWTTAVETDMNVKLVATSRTGLRAERAFFVKGEGTAIIGVQRLYDNSLENGIRDLLAKMVGAILELMTQYPELGFRHHQPAVVAWRLEQGR